MVKNASMLVIVRMCVMSGGEKFEGRNICDKH